MKTLRQHEGMYSVEEHPSDSTCKYEPGFWGRRQQSLCGATAPPSPRSRFVLAIQWGYATTIA